MVRDVTPNEHQWKRGVEFMRDFWGRAFTTFFANDTALCADPCSAAWDAIEADARAVFERHHAAVMSAECVDPSRLFVVDLAKLAESPPALRRFLGCDDGGGSARAELMPRSNARGVSAHASARKAPPRGGCPSRAAAPVAPKTGAATGDTIAADEAAARDKRRRGLNGHGRARWPVGAAGDAGPSDLWAAPSSAPLLEAAAHAAPAATPAHAAVRTALRRGDAHAVDGFMSASELALLRRLLLEDGYALAHAAAKNSFPNKKKVVDVGVALGARTADAGLDPALLRTVHGILDRAQALAFRLPWRSELFDVAQMHAAKATRHVSWHLTGSDFPPHVDFAPNCVAILLYVSEGGGRDFVGGELETRGCPDLWQCPLTRQHYEQRSAWRMACKREASHTPKAGQLVAFSRRRRTRSPSSPTARASRSTRGRTARTVRRASASSCTPTRGRPSSSAPRKRREATLEFTVHRVARWAFHSGQRRAHSGRCGACARFIAARRGTVCGEVVRVQGRVGSSPLVFVLGEIARVWREILISMRKWHRFQPHKF